MRIPGVIGLSFQYHKVSEKFCTRVESKSSLSDRAVWKLAVHRAIARSPRPPPPKHVATRKLRQRNRRELYLCESTRNSRLLPEAGGARQAHGLLAQNLSAPKRELRSECAVRVQSALCA